VLVGVLVGVFVGVLVGVFVGVLVGVFVGVIVGVSVGVLVGVLVGVEVGVLVGVLVGVAVGQGSEFCTSNPQPSHSDCSPKYRSLDCASALAATSNNTMTATLINALQLVDKISEALFSLELICV
jgi:hypothetical protein